jgi:hypothetical protein|tara:strand:- start:1876 stop:2040 length:165 start_codon:yes stop_codon:yes gene_type:complete
LADRFIEKCVIDEDIIDIVAIILNKRRPLFLENDPLIKLDLFESSMHEGIVILE